MPARLHRVRPYADPGFRRERRDDRVVYLAPNGDEASAADLARIEALALPPAWSDVWIAADPIGHIQAVGVDAAGRHQYRYHERWRSQHADRKFDRVLDLAAALPHARGRATSALHATDDAKRRLAAVAFRVLDEASPRVGSIRYLEQRGTRGLTTLIRSDATVDGARITLDFPGKSHVEDVLHLDDRVLAPVVVELTSAGEPDGQLLSTVVDGSVVRLTAADVNAFLHEVAGAEFTAKDFRTLRGTIAAAEALARAGTRGSTAKRAAVERAAVKAASRALCNTPAVARANYIDPRVFEAYADGRLLDLDRSPDAAVRALVLPHADVPDADVTDPTA